MVLATSSVFLSRIERLLAPVLVMSSQRPPPAKPRPTIARVSGDGDRLKNAVRCKIDPLHRAGAIVGDVDKGLVRRDCYLYRARVSWDFSDALKLFAIDDRDVIGGVTGDITLAVLVAPAPSDPGTHRGPLPPLRAWQNDSHIAAPRFVTKIFSSETRAKCGIETDFDEAYRSRRGSIEKSPPDHRIR